MGLDLRYTANRSYFAYHKPVIALRCIGAFFAAIALGGIIFPTVSAPFGFLAIVFFLVSRDLNETDSDVDEQIRRETERLCAEFENKHVDVMRPYPRMVVSSVGDFVTEGEGLKTRRSGDLGKIFTSRYQVVAIGLRNRRLYYSGERYSLIDEKEYATTEGVYNYLDLARAEYGPVEGAEIPHFEFALIKRNGEEAFRVPAPDNTETERYAEDLNLSLENARAKEAQETNLHQP
ncbi:MAG: hypothetical protein J5958_04950 [Clostridia bacterium]|nr:hypothetical protein [Clostridia bacterium]